MSDTTWREEISKEMKDNNDDWSFLVGCTLSNDGLDIVFDRSYGCEEGEPFTLWTQNFVYFPVCYDGAEWCGSVPRNPCLTKTSHQGGG